MKASVLAILFISQCLLSVAQRKNIPSDLNIVTIGTQKWMSKNLNVSHFRNGDEIKKVNSIDEWMLAISGKVPAYCSYNFDSSNDVKYGKLYNWFAIADYRLIAPKGFRNPIREDFEKLISFAGGPSTSWTTLAAASGWNHESNGNDKFGFALLPAGYIGPNGFDSEMEVGNSVTFLGTSSLWEQHEDLPRFTLFNRDVVENEIKAYGLPFSYGVAIRCIKEN